MSLAAATVLGTRENLISNSFAFPSKFQRLSSSLWLNIESPHFMTYLLSHHDLAPGFAPRKCCCSEAKESDGLDVLSICHFWN